MSVIFNSGITGNAKKDSVKAHRRKVQAHRRKVQAHRWKVQAHRRKVQAHQEHFKHSYSDFVRNAPTLREAIRNDSYDNEYKSLQGEQRLLDTSCANRSRDLN
jgi:hypothetical protein